MNPEELLEITSKTPTVAFHKFVLLSKGRFNDLFCFFEGKDCQYYSLRIKQYVRRNYHPISCGNKNTVLETFMLFESSSDYKNHRKAFFVDTDFDVKINNSNIYETPCYSVENLYANGQVLSEILKNEFGLCEEDKEFKILMGIFEENQNAFNNYTLLFNGWYAALKDKKRREGLRSTKVNLDDKLPKNFIVLKIGFISSRYDLQRIKEFFPDAINVTEDEVNRSIEELKKSDLNFNLRGKYQLWFFCSFLQFIINDANKEKHILSKTTKFNADRGHMISNLSQYALTPDCLIEYLSHF